MNIYSLRQPGTDDGGWTICKVPEDQVRACEEHEISLYETWLGEDHKSLKELYGN